MYIAVLVIPVPEEKKDAYREWAVRSAAIFKKYGCIEIVDAWGPSALGDIVSFKHIDHFDLGGIVRDDFYVSVVLLLNVKIRKRLGSVPPEPENILGMEEQDDRISIEKIRMKLELHLHFDGCCRQAFNFYAEKLGGKIESLLTYGESPAVEQVPVEHRDKIVHASMLLGDLHIAGADVISNYTQANGFNLILQLQDEEDARAKFECLAEGGEIVMPLQRTFWSSSYGILRDKFGMPWEVNCSTQFDK